MNDIYTRLKNGETAEDIVSKLTEELNQAEARIKEEEAAKAAETAKATAARDDLAAILSSLGDWVAKYYPDSEASEEFAEADPSTYTALADLFISLLDLNQVKVKVAPKGKKISVNTKFTSDKPVLADPFDSFFKTFGL